MSVFTFADTNTILSSTNPKTNVITKKLGEIQEIDKLYHLTTTTKHTSVSYYLKEYLIQQQVQFIIHYSKEHIVIFRLSEK